MQSLMLNSNSSTGCLSIFSHGQRQYLPFHLISRLEADSNYTCIYTIDGKKLMSSRHLSFFSNLLPPNFIRVHKSSIVNRIYFVEVTKKKNEICLADQCKVLITKRHAKRIKEELMMKN
jgi:DNA-binding LytR/AlgR family response regulator